MLRVRLGPWIHCPPCPGKNNWYALRAVPAEARRHAAMSKSPVTRSATSPPSAFFQPVPFSENGRTSHPILKSLTRSASRPCPPLY